MTPARPGLPAAHVPVIETARLKLRAHRASDLDPMARMWSDPAVVRHIGGQTRSRPDVWMRLLRSLGNWSLLGYGYWAVEDRETGAFVGEAGLMEAMRDIEPSFIGLPEAGWCFVADVWGRGFASEAVLAVVAWADTALAGHDLRCIIEPGHAASIRIAEKAGFQPLADTIYARKPIRIFARPG